jgi:hypothetical protein
VTPNSLALEAEYLLSHPFLLVVSQTSYAKETLPFPIISALNSLFCLSTSHKINNQQGQNSEMIITDFGARLSGFRLQLCY